MDLKRMMANVSYEDRKKWRTHGMSMYNQIRLLDHLDHLDKVIDTLVILLKAKCSDKEWEEASKRYEKLING